MGAETNGAGSQKNTTRRRRRSDDNNQQQQQATTTTTTHHAYFCRADGCIVSGMRKEHTPLSSNVFMHGQRTKLEGKLKEEINMSVLCLLLCDTKIKKRKEWQRQNKKIKKNYYTFLRWTSAFQTTTTKRTYLCFACKVWNFITQTKHLLPGCILLPLVANGRHVSVSANNRVLLFIFGVRGDIIIFSRHLPISSLPGKLLVKVKVHSLYMVSGSWHSPWLLRENFNFT